MTWTPRLLVRECAFTAFAFTFAINIYYITAFWGMQDVWMEGTLKNYMSGVGAQVEILIAGILFGGSIGLINRFTERLGVRQRPFYQVVLLMTAMNLLSFALVTIVVVVVMIAFVMSAEELIRIFRAITLRNAVSILFLQVVVVWAINFSLEIQRIIGFENLWRIITGRYRIPQEENRVFLFIDLKGSTAIAEYLGHQKFSEMLQRCYQDLTQVALQFGASIYQYVGDEVVMSWPTSGTDAAPAAGVRAFFAYEQRLLQHREMYRTSFGVLPEFRGGIDVGPVMATEVGDMKREIVFHGDVLNTASRLLDVCKRRGERLLASDAVSRVAATDPAIRTKWTESIRLRGKHELVVAHSFEDIE